MRWTRSQGVDTASGSSLRARQASEHVVNCSAHRSLNFGEAGLGLGRDFRLESPLLGVAVREVRSDQPPSDVHGSIRDHVIVMRTQPPSSSKAARERWAVVVIKPPVE